VAEWQTPRALKKLVPGTGVGVRVSPSATDSDLSLISQGVTGVSPAPNKVGSPGSIPGAWDFGGLGRRSGRAS